MVPAPEQFPISVESPTKIKYEQPLGLEVSLIKSKELVYSIKLCENIKVT